MRKIKGFNYEGEHIEDSLNFIEEMLGRKLTEDEEQEVGTLWNWNYDDEDCVEMIKEGMSAIEYDEIQGEDI